VSAFDFLNPIGHFHGDVQVCSVCCPFEVSDQPGACSHPDAQWAYYASDVSERHVGPLCDQCGLPVVATGTAPVVRVTMFLREGTGWFGDPPEFHPITITDVSAGVERTPGSEFDWFCTLDSCQIISEGLPNGDSHPSPDAAEHDAVEAHLADGVDLCRRSASRVRTDVSNWDERPF
jgi:hypothetical protein